VLQLGHSIGTDLSVAPEDAGLNPPLEVTPHARGRARTGASW
jgi:hypothetical protein